MQFKTQVISYGIHKFLIDFNLTDKSPINYSQHLARAVAEYPDKDLWWLGQDIAQIGLDEGYKCIAASSYNYKAVLIGLVEAFQGGKLGGEVIPMNFSNGGFIWAWNEKCADKITPEIKSAVEAKMAEFTAKADILSNWADVDYSKL